MATGVEASILEGLLAHLSSLTLVPAKSVAWPNVDFDPPDSGYLGVQLFPASTNQIALGDTGQNRHRGVFQVSVFWELGEGELDAQEAAASVAAHFKRGTQLLQDGLYVRVLTPPTVGPAVYDKKYIQIPVSIEYQVDADNPA